MGMNVNKGWFLTDKFKTKELLQGKPQSGAWLLGRYYKTRGSESLTD